MANYLLDVRKLYRAVQDRRELDGLTWDAWYARIGTVPRTKIKLQRGEAPDPHVLVSILHWLERDARDFALSREEFEASIEC